MSEPHSNGKTRGTAWTVALFYVLIAFEFFYMASPFAAYFYSVYRPGLGFLEHVPGGQWLVGFFLPHYVDTTSTLIDSARLVGGVLLGGGLLAFAVGAFQVYHAKLRRRGAVLGGVYRLVRHPQYTALAISGLGLLLLWPRYLVLLLFVTMLFVYHLLACLEERECTRRFGDAYVEYLRRTSRFLPFRPGWLLRARARLAARWPSSRAGRLGAGATLYAVTLSGALLAAHGLHHATLSNLYAHYTPNAAYVALAEIPAPKLRRLAALAANHPDVKRRLARAAGGGGATFINYVLRQGRYVSEVPMHEPPGARGHDTPTHHDGRRYVVVFTRARLRTGRRVRGPDILRYAVSRTPIVEVHVDLGAGRVTRVLDPPAKERYPSVPVPLL